MTEEEFWRSNPRKIKVYEKAWRDEQNYINTLAYTFWGNYGISALQTVISGILTPMFCGKPSKAKYMDEPVRLFARTEQELEEYKEQQTQAFINWCNAMESNWDASHKSPE